MVKHLVHNLVLFLPVIIPQNQVPSLLFRRHCVMLVWCPGN